MAVTEVRSLLPPLDFLGCQTIRFLVENVAIMTLDPLEANASTASQGGYHARYILRSEVTRVTGAASE